MVICLSFNICYVLLGIKYEFTRIENLRNPYVYLHFTQHPNVLETRVVIAQLFDKTTFKISLQMFLERFQIYLHTCMKKLEGTRNRNIFLLLSFTEKSCERERCFSRGEEALLLHDKTVDVCPKNDEIFFTCCWFEKKKK